DLAAADQTDVAARAAHVERDEVVDPEELPEVVTGDDPARQTGEEQLDRLGLRRLRGRLAAVRLHPRPGHAEVFRRQRVPRAGHVLLHDRLDVAVGDAGAAALVLAPDRGDFVRERNRDVRKALPQKIPYPQLVRGVDVGKQQADGDREVARRVLA